MFSIRENEVREKQFADQHPTSNANGTHHFVATLTDDSSLFLLHRFRERESNGTLPRRRRRWQFWRR